MVKKLISYTIEKMNPSARTKLHRELFGFTDSSNHGKYKYKRKGLVEETSSKRINDALILTNEKSVHKFEQLLNCYKAKKWIFSVIED